MLTGKSISIVLHVAESVTPSLAPHFFIELEEKHTIHVNHLICVGITI